ncbi:MAG: MATE family efflux transporter [Acidimicrobiales bacterium]
MGFSLRRKARPYDSEIARLAVPALGTLVAEPLYVLADTAIVGRIGTNELAGLALASAVLLTVHALTLFLTYGTTATVARLIGAGRQTDAAFQSVQGLWLAALLGTGSAILLFFTGTWFLELFGGKGEPLAFAERYLGISLIGLPFLLLNLAGAGAFTGRQNTKTPLLVALAGATANLVIELILVPGLGYGVGASALSTVVSQIGTGLFLAWAVIRWAGRTGVSLRPNFGAVIKLMSAGRALILRAVALRGSFALGTAVAARIGVAELAAHQVAMQIWGTLSLALDAVAIAGQALTGRWLGAGDAEQARGAARRMIELDVWVGVVAAIGLFVAREPLAALFSNDPAVVSATAFVLIWAAVSQPLNGYVFALDGILIGAGDLNYLGKTMAASAVVFAGLGVVLMRSGGGLGWLWALITLLMLMRAVALWVRWRSDRWVVLGADT